MTHAVEPAAPPAPPPSSHTAQPDAAELAKIMRRLQRLHDFGRLTAFTFTAVIDGDTCESGAFGEVDADEVVSG
jgi:hypothetical protein